jgi:hypothetical protein
VGHVHMLGAVAASMVLFAAPSAIAQVTPGAQYYEVDGDYGSRIENVAGKGAGSHAYDAAEIVDGGDSTYATRDADYCTDFVHTTLAPYMGAQAYSVTCGPNQADETRRSEQMLVNQWYAGSDAQRYVSFAYRLRDLSTTPPDRSTGYIAQWHEGGQGPPPVRLQWYYFDGAYHLDLIVRHDETVNGTCQTASYTFPYRVFQPGDWIRILVAVDLGSSPAASDGAVYPYVMNNETGQWESLGSYEGPVGFASSIDGRTCTGSPRSDTHYQFKVGQYATSDGIGFTADYDNVAYGRRWNNITKNKLVGYAKSVLRYRFEESSSTVADTSYLWNGGSAGDATADYNNDGTVSGTRIITPGLTGNAIKLDGTNYVSTPIDTTDMDLGNYVTVSAWFKTTSHPTTNRGLVMIDEFSTTWKLLFYYSDTFLSFGVRYPDNTYARADYSFSAGTYADNQWHHVVGVYNRFSPDMRVTLYVDGQPVADAIGKDLPMLRGNDRLVVGKFSSSNLFVGAIDEVGLFNYPMTDDDVHSLYLERGTP